MAVKKRGDHWHYDFTIRGVRYREAIPEARTQSQAIRAETQAREEVYNGKFRKRDHTPKLADFIDETYLPWSKKNKPSWYDDELIIKHVIKPALGAKRLDLDNEVISYMTKEEEARLLRHCAGDREHLRAIVLIAVNTGMRTKEMFNLRKYQLDFNLNRIVIGHRVRGLETTKTKTGKGRIIPMNSIVREELLKLAQGKGDLEYLFTYPATGQRIKSVKRSFAKACEKAKLEGFRFYDLRHTFGTRLAEAGESLHRIAELMGHSNIQMTMRYAHAVASGKHAAVERLASYGDNPGHKSVTKAKEQAG